MQNKIIKICIGSVLIFGIGVLVYATKQQPAAIQVTPAAQVGEKKVETIAMSEVTKHNSRTDCWSVVNGNVYNLTSWIPNHPGGEAVILSMCGTDGTALYTGEHKTKSKPARVLGGFKLGAIAK